MQLYGADSRVLLRRLHHLAPNFLSLEGSRGQVDVFQAQLTALEAQVSVKSLPLFEVQEQKLVKILQEMQVEASAEL